LVYQWQSRFGGKLLCQFDTSNALFSSIIRRQIVAYKNLIEASEHLNVMLVLAVGKLLTDYMSSNDYHEFVKRHVLFRANIFSAEDFLQRDSIFDKNIDEDLKRWYITISNDFLTASFHATKNADILTNTRHNLVLATTKFSDHVNGMDYYYFVTEQILPAISNLQQTIKDDVR
jgi:hypothetical protein